MSKIKGAIADLPPVKRMQVGKKLKRILLLSFGALYLVGLTYWLSHLFLQRQAEFGPEPHLLEKLTGPIHVALALFFLVVMGMIWSQHISPALKTRRSRFTGWMFLIWVGVLGFSGVGIIYGGEALVHLLEWIHPWVGVLMGPTLIWHWRARRKSA